ncbi:hypothetical protein KC367_g8899 [Hortaea werneckii]|nr:hypothetical protein KC367_g8899 [Hortaea werneckii]
MPANAKYPGLTSNGYIDLQVFSDAPLLGELPFADYRIKDVSVQPELREADLSQTEPDNKIQGWDSIGWDTPNLYTPAPYAPTSKAHIISLDTWADYNHDAFQGLPLEWVHRYDVVSEELQKYATHPKAKAHATSMLQILTSRIDWTGNFPLISHIAIKPSGQAGASFRVLDLVKGVSEVEAVITSSSIPEKATVVCVSLAWARRIAGWDKDVFERLKMMGVLVVVAAGNESIPAELGACGTKGVFGVAGFDSKNKQLETSNFGRCVSLLGPGQVIAALTGQTKLYGIVTGSSVVPYVLATRIIETWDKLGLDSLQAAMQELIKSAVRGAITLKPYPTEATASPEQLREYYSPMSDFSRDHDGEVYKPILQVIRDPGSTPNLAIGGREHRRKWDGV